MKSAQNGFFAKIFQPSKQKKQEEEKYQSAYNKGVSDTMATIIKATNLKFSQSPTPEALGKQFHALWESKRNLAKQQGDAQTLRALYDDTRAKNNQLQSEMQSLRTRLSQAEAWEKQGKSESARADKAEHKASTLNSQLAMMLKDPYISNRWQQIQREQRERSVRANSIIDRFIQEGRNALHAFAQTKRIDFNHDEANYIYYGILATSVKDNISLENDYAIGRAVESFLSGLSWSDISSRHQYDVSNWTNIFATKEVNFNDSITDRFLSFVNYMSGSPEAYNSLGGSNGCADQLTNWDGSKKLGLGCPENTKRKGYSL